MMKSIMTEVEKFDFISGNGSGISNTFFIRYSATFFLINVGTMGIEQVYRTLWFPNNL